MNKTQREKIDDIFYNQVIENNINEKRKQEKKKLREREKRIKQVNKIKQKEQETFDMDTETVIGMTNRNNKIKTRQVQEQLSRKEKRRQRKLKRIKKIIKCTSIIGIFVGVIIFALVSPIFNIQEIEVIGNQIVESNTIISLSELSKDQNIFKFINPKVEVKIKENPYIETVKIKRKIPNKVQIQVEEKKQDFNIEFLNGYAYINKQGDILEISENKLDIPVIQGAKTSEEKIVPGSRLEEEDLEKLETAIQIMDVWQNNEIENKITSIDISNKNEYTIYIEQEKKKIYIGDKTNLNNKILWVQAIIEDNKGIEGEIYVNGNLNGNFRPRFKQKV